jgi:DNA-binding transcriptional LysR family regulator
MSHDLLARGVNMERLDVFLRVVDRGSLMAAASGNKSLQSSYSRQIKALEEALGQQLFAREGKSLRLTPAGRRLALLTKSFLAALEALADGAEAMRIRIGAGDSVLETVLYPKLKRLASVLPNRAFQFQSRSTRQISQGLREGTLDFGVLRDSAVEPGWQSKTLGTVAFCLVVPRARLPEGEWTGFGDLEGQPFVSLTGEGSFVSSLSQLMEKWACKVRVVAEAESFTKIAKIAEAAECAAVLPEGLAKALPHERFVLEEDASLSVLSRTLVLAASEQALKLRPDLDEVFERLAMHLLVEDVM